jgi:hypothetical protein
VAGTIPRPYAQTEFGGFDAIPVAWHKRFFEVLNFCFGRISSRLPVPISERP